MNVLTILDHYLIYVVSIKYFFEAATIMMIVPFIGTKRENTPNFNINYMFAILVVYMTILGIFQSDMTITVFEYDFFSFLRFLICILIGSKQEFYTTVKKAMMIILFLGVIANILSLFSSETFVRSMLEEKTLTDKLQYVLLPGLFYLFQYDRLNKNERRIVVAAVTVYAIEQVLFQKRLPTLRIVVTLLIYVYSLQLFQKDGLKFDVLIKRISLFVLGIFLCIQLFGILGFNIGEYADLLFQRFYKEDSVGETLDEDERWKIGAAFYETLENSNEFFTGRGIGGVVYDNSFLLDDANGRSYRSAAEMGIPTMMLKGGIPLVAFFGFIFFKVLQLFKICKKNEFLFAGWVSVFIWFVFLYAEGFIGNYLSPFEILLGYSIGLILSSDKINGDKFEPDETY
jgi:hypothetical protein